MRWTPGNESSNIEDRRGSSGGGFGPLHFGVGGTIVVLVLSLVFHRNLFTLFDGSGSTASVAAGDSAAPPATESAAEHREVSGSNFMHRPFSPVPPGKEL